MGTSIRIVFLLLTFLIYFGQSYNIFAQDTKRQVAVFVYCDKSVTTPINALCSRLSSSLAGGDNSQFIVVDRSEEIQQVLRTEYKYQGSGLVRDDQLTAIGEQLGIDLICAINITFYSEYGQYFFDCKLINVESAQVEKQVYFPNSSDSQQLISDLSPQSQLAVAQELASSIGLLSASQIIDREYAIGDVLYDNKNNPVGYDIFYRVGYLDETRKHGIAFCVHNKTKWPHHFDSRLGAKVPTIRQLQLLQSNKNKLGLYGEYWSSDIGPKIGDNFTFKTLDFYTGKVVNRISVSTRVNHDTTSTAVLSARYRYIYGNDRYDDLEDFENLSIIVF